MQRDHQRSQGQWTAVENMRLIVAGENEHFARRLDRFGCRARNLPIPEFSKEACRIICVTEMSLEVGEIADRAIDQRAAFRRRGLVTFCPARLECIQRPRKISVM
jgi:hypothetical protein